MRIQYEALGRALPFNIPFSARVTRCTQNVELALRCVLPDSHRPRVDDRTLGVHLQSGGLADLIQATFAFVMVEWLLKIPKQNLRTREFYEICVRPVAVLHYVSGHQYVWAHTFHIGTHWALIVEGRIHFVNCVEKLRHDSGVRVFGFALEQR